jgi:CheY-like chemotaxis protein
MTGALKQQKRSSGSQVISRKPGILIADDMALMDIWLKLELESRGFSVWLAVDSDDALDLYRRNRAEIDLVLLDVQLPGLGGPHTLESLQRVNRGVFACFLMGNSGPSTVEELKDRGAACVFRKPFCAGEVADLLQRLASPAPDVYSPFSSSMPFFGHLSFSSDQRGTWARASSATRPSS